MNWQNVTSDFTKRALSTFSSSQKGYLTARDFAESVWSDREIGREQVYAARLQLLRLQKVGLVERRRIISGGRVQRPRYYLTSLGAEELDKVTATQAAE